MSSGITARRSRSTARASGAMQLARTGPIWAAPLWRQRALLANLFHHHCYAHWRNLTRFGKDPAAELGAAAHWHQPVGTHLLFLAGADIHDVARRRLRVHFIPELRRAISTRPRGSGRAASTARYCSPRAVDHDLRDESITSPILTPANTRLRLLRCNCRVEPDGLRSPSGHYASAHQTLAVSASAFRAYRAPTENELYRTGQVGSQTTLPNPNLRSERATGWEAGVHADLPSIGSTVRVSYFWNQINRPITALTLTTTPTSTLLIGKTWARSRAGVFLSTSLHSPKVG